MQPRFGIRTKLLLSILAILLVSYSSLLYSTTKTLNGLSATEIEKSLDANLKHARKEFLHESDLARYSLMQPLTSSEFLERFVAQDQPWLVRHLEQWEKVLPHLELLLLVDRQKQVMAALDGPGRGRFLELTGVVDHAVATRKVVVSVELVPVATLARAGAEEFCKLRADQGEVLMIAVAIPIFDRGGRLLGCCLAGDILNDDNKFAKQIKVAGTDAEISINQLGRPVASSFPPGAALAPSLEPAVMDRLERSESFRGQISVRDRRYESVMEPLFNSRGEFVGALSVAVSREKFDKVRNASLANILISASLGILCCFGLAFMASRQFAAPLRQLAFGVKRVEEGDLNQRVDEGHGDEIGMLAASFNKMAASLKERDRIITLKTEDLQELNEQLELKVAERTSALTMEMGRLEAVLTSMAEGVVVTDRNNRVVLFNPAAQQIFELVPYRVVGQPIEAVCDVAGFAPLVRRIRELGALGSAVKEELEAKGKKLKVNLCALNDETGGFAGVVISIRDVTAEEEVDRMKTEFISTVSHELKTPLTSMKGSLQLLLSRGKWLTDTERQLLSVCFRNTQRLIRLITEILDISGIESGGMAFELKPVCIGEVAVYAVEEIRSFAMGRNITIVNSVGEHLPQVLGDRDRLVQVVTNLLSNAVKFSPEGKVVMVSAEQEGNYVTVSVADRGQAIERADREKLFKKFQQIESNNRQKVSGTGLGLAICKEIVERHHGRIFYSAAKENGNTFSFTVPIIGEGHASKG